MKITKHQLKKIIKEELGNLDELGMYQHVPDEPVSGDLLGALQEVVEIWDPITAEGEQYEQEVLALISRFGTVEEGKVSGHRSEVTYATEKRGKSKKPEKKAYNKAVRAQAKRDLKK